MRTVIKYVFYLVLIAILYIVISAMYNGTINKSTTMSEVGTEIKTGAEKMVSDTANGIKDAVK
ncbi:MAG: hypothetical protein IKC10_05035 [Alphaproteobacteria bacterium]|nr:hypothetical protein [Alphaproteobacteria bacterium]